MTFKQLLGQVAYADMASYIDEAARQNAEDLRPQHVKTAEVRRAYDELLAARPPFGFIDTPIEVKMAGGRLSVSNMHLGSPTDLLSHRLRVAADVTAPQAEIAAQCLYQLAAHEAVTQKYREGDEFDDLDPQMARIVR